MTDRLAHIVERLKLQPGHLVLEIGCGHGVAVSMICERLVTGRYIAIDRSAKMIAAATSRNAAFVRNGLADFRVGAFETVDFGDLRFDRILAVRVRLLLDDDARAQAKRWLKPGGKLLVEYDEPG